MLQSVPFVDLVVSQRRVQEEVWAALHHVVETTDYVLGDTVAAFEDAYADFCGTAHCVGVGNGTDAIEIALRAAGVGVGDEVILPANTFVATAEAVARSGARIVLADVTADHLIDPECVGRVVTGRTRAVIPVHLYGQMAPMAAVRESVGDDVILIEDAAQSQGARQDGRRSGSMGRVAATSFYPGKNLGAFGDAGAITTDDDEVAHRARQLRNHGGVSRYEQRVPGMNSRLDGMQAAVLLAQLKVLDDWNDERRAAATRYAELLGDIPGLDLPAVTDGNEHVWHLYVVASDERDSLLAHLQASGVGAGIHYPVPIHLLEAFTHLGHQPGDFPVAERSCARILSLPMFPGITAAQQQRVTDVVTDFDETRWPARSRLGA
jgi:dTDP-4-amino-4,6-dideoxygalactose transaminase